ncbi:hypothetical protein PITCH_A720083 [uncultured Desulfobacterium sp.]|uniref:Uncharacterized protein n=1 Tax=uncultured Desulfobacterium sp. TaxID=201089 RepID=A0A445N215_9BACT|nr:hypothetical protein PITCH_A720083 [uncultured Desulfobacterium sp.]
MFHQITRSGILPGALLKPQGARRPERRKNRGLRPFTVLKKLGGFNVSYQNEAAFGGRFSLRTQNQEMESQNEAIYLRLTQRDTHH